MADLRLILPVIAVLFFAQTFHLSQADIAAASHYGPPYSPTACFGGDESSFPKSNLFAAAGEGIWDNGASCGRKYLVRCLSATVPGTCIVGQTIQIIIVDRAQTAPSPPSKPGTAFALSGTAYDAIARRSTGATFINLEYQQI